MNRAKRGRWIIHEVGCQKTIACSKVFYSSCVERLKDMLGYSIDYIPWMASPSLAKAFEERPSDFDAIRAKNILDFNVRYLSSIDNFLSASILLQETKMSASTRVFQEISRSGPISIGIYDKALALSNNWQPWMKLMLRAVVKSIIPICRSDSQIEDGNSFSDHHFIGAIFTSVDPRSPFPDLTLNISFAHELAHQALMIYQHSGDLLLSSEDWVYSGVRKTLRPAIASLHAALALAFMIECTEALIREETDALRIAYLRAILSENRKNLGLGLVALAELRKSELCQWIYDDLHLLTV